MISFIGSNHDSHPCSFEIVDHNEPHHHAVMFIILVKLNLLLFLLLCFFVFVLLGHCPSPVKNDTKFDSAL